MQASGAIPARFQMAAFAKVRSDIKLQIVFCSRGPKQDALDECLMHSL